MQLNVVLATALLAIAPAKASPFVRLLFSVSGGETQAAVSLNIDPRRETGPLKVPELLQDSDFERGESYFVNWVMITDSSAGVSCVLVVPPQDKSLVPSEGQIGAITNPGQTNYITLSVEDQFQFLTVGGSPVDLSEATINCSFDPSKIPKEVLMAEEPKKESRKWSWWWGRNKTPASKQ
ncbi:unnamed protein product [Diplocarpon coronariae]|uniref:Uncharacterized protein n=1 Tax=Diplocarpon coronariae TaxID=2795749 RepID=A0A218Z974_9HELO|nr:hypothetical protein B2J93_9312 [Marssonina coronariae]